MSLRSSNRCGRAHRTALSLFALSLAGSAAIAQVPLGSLVALTAGSSDPSIRRLYVVSGAGGVATQITGLAPNFSGTINCVAVDTVSPFPIPSTTAVSRGHLVVAAKTTAGNELWQLYLSGTQIVGDRKLVDLPIGNVVELHRAGNGCFMALTQNGFGNGTLSRISITENGASAYHQPLGLLASNGVVNGLTSGPDGYAYIGQTLITNPVTPPLNLLYRVEVNGDVSIVGNPNFNVLALAYNGTAPGSALVAGGAPIASQATNFWCGGGPFSLAPQDIASAIWPSVQDIELDASNGTFLLAMNSGGIPASFGATQGSQIRRFVATGCPLSGPTVLASFPNEVVWDVSLSTNAIGYGCAAPTSAGTYPVIRQSAQPAVGTTWTPALANATPSSLTYLYVGTDTLFFLGLPLPLDASALGAQPGAALITSGTWVFPATTDAGGAATYQIAVPNVPTLVGNRIYAQSVVFDTALPYTLQIAMSAAIAPTIQP